MITQFIFQCKHWSFQKILRPYFSRFLIKAVLRSIQERPSEIAPRSDARFILALNHIRYRGELESLMNTGRVRILQIPFTWQTRFFYYFHDRNRTIETLLNEHLQSEEDKKRQKDYQDFLMDVFAVLKSRCDIQAVITANYMYVQDYDWFVAAQKSGIQASLLYRGGMMTCAGLYRDFVERYKKIDPYKGDRILVHNEHAKQMFLDSGFAKEEQIYTLGSPRMERFIQEAIEHQENLPQRFEVAATLFSFGHSAGLFGNMLDAKFKEHFDGIWSINGNLGYVELFDKTHQAFAMLAHNHPDLNFVIKTKWGNIWFDKIAEALAKIDLTLDNLPNLKLSCDDNPHDLIFRSKVICSFGSTTLLEAALAGKHIIFPLFAEALKEEYRDYIPFYDMQDLFEVATSAEDLSTCLEQAIISDKQPSPELTARRQQKFVEFISPLRTDVPDLYVDVLCDEKQAGGE